MLGSINYSLKGFFFLIPNAQIWIVTWILFSSRIKVMKNKKIFFNGFITICQQNLTHIFKIVDYVSVFNI